MKKVALLLLLSTVAFAQKPNVLFIAVDDLKPLMGCYGDKHVKTPNIDRLARMGTVFQSNYCQQAVCAPTRASLLTGQRPDYTRIWDLQTQIRDINPSIVTLPQYFAQNGYVTAGVGKVFDNRSVDKADDAVSWTLPYQRLKDQDFAEGYGRPLDGYYQKAENRQMLAKFKATAAERNLQGKALADFQKQHRGPAVEWANVPDDAYSDGAVAKRAVATIRELAQNQQPFFYAVGFVKPHLPFVSPQKYWDLYDRTAIKTAEFQALSQDTPPFAFQASGELVSTYLLTNGDYFPKGYAPQKEEIQQELIHGYYAAISYMDAQVGKLLDALDANGLTKNTIIVLWGDHGWHLGDHGIWCKHTNFEQATRAPLIIASPYHKGNQQAHSLTEFVDVFPTLADLAGLKVPDGLAGKSLVSVLKNPKAKVKTFAQSQYPRNGDKLMGYAIRTERYRYVAWIEADFRKNKVTAIDKIVAEELYDYQKDPNETKNLAVKADYQKVLSKHKALAMQFLTEQKHTR